MASLGIFATLASLFTWGTPAQELPQHTLVNLKQVIPGIVLDIKYATSDNFTRQVLYQSAECYLLEHVAKALADVQKELKTKGLGLKVWDGYRPLAAQYKMWDVVKGTPQEMYVAEPPKASRHTRGTAVDVTLVHLGTGNELEMPTAFDDFTERAWRSSTDCSYKAQVNRRLLEKVMHAHGFIGVDCEWWHFDYQGWQEQAVLEVDFKDLK